MGRGADPPVQSQLRWPPRVECVGGPRLPLVVNGSRIVRVLLVRVDALCIVCAVTRAAPLLRKLSDISVRKQLLEQMRRDYQP